MASDLNVDKKKVLSKPIVYLYPAGLERMEKLLRI
jgi:hypothetical protein